MGDNLSPEERTAANEKEQSDGIGDMVKALSVGPVETKKEDKKKDDKKDKKDEKLEKKKDEEEEENADEEDEESEDEEDESDEEEGDEEDEEDKEDESDDDEEEDIEGEEEDKEDEEDEEDSDEESDEEDEEESDEDEDDDTELQLAILKAENEALKKGGKGKTDEEINEQLGVANIKDLEDIDFVGEDDDVEEIASTKEGLNKLLNAVRTKTMQEMMVVLPGLAANLVTERTTLQTAVDKFYEDNEDFVKHKDYVGLVAQQIQSKHPGLNYETMFKLVEKTVRKNLSLKKKVEKTRKNEGKDKKKPKRTDKSNPAFSKKGAGGGGSGRRKKDARTETQKEMDQMTSAVG